MQMECKVEVLYVAHSVWCEWVCVRKGCRKYVSENSTIPFTLESCIVDDCKWTDYSIVDCFAAKQKEREGVKD